MQRRQLTILFSDLVGSTELSSRVDPEDLHVVMGAFQRNCAQCVEEAGGYVARFMGDGLLAYFGYPSGHEDDAARAVQAAIAINRAVQLLKTPSGEALRVRSGIATGQVVVGDLMQAGLATEHAVAGATPNLAARLQSAAAPNTIVVADLTRRLAGGAYTFRSLGRMSLKGLPDEEAWALEGELREQSRRSADLPRAPFVGRRALLDTLVEAWRDCAGGQGRAIGLVGEPGIGKSRLVQAFASRIGREPHVWLQGAGVRVFRNTSFHLIAQMLRRRLAFARPNGRSDLERLSHLLELAGMDGPTVAPLLAELAGVEAPEAVRPETAGVRRERLIALLGEWVSRTAAKWPTVMVLEDMQWADPSTREFMDAILKDGPPPGLLLLYTARTREAFDTVLGQRHEQVEIPPLEAEAVRELIRATGRRDMPLRLVEDLVARAGGVPLFAEELAHLMVGDDGSEREIPATLSSLLAARLDELGPAKPLAQIASVVGDEFEPRLLAVVSGESEDRVSEALKRLLELHLIVALRSRGRTTYAFRHGLIRDAAYGALLRSQRRALHERVAMAIEAGFADRRMARQEVLAQHWSRAEHHDKALDAWHAAARASVRRRAYAEARQAYAEALGSLLTFPESSWREGLELELQSAFSAVLQITSGYSAKATVAATARARELAERGGDARAQFVHGSGLWMAASSNGEYDAANRMAEKLMPLARAAGDDETLATAHMIMLTARYRVGDLSGSEEAFETGQRYFESQVFRGRAGAVSQTYGNAAVVAWLAGDAARALARSQENLTLSQAGGNGYDIAFSRYMAGALAVMMSDMSTAARLAEGAIAVSDELGFPQYAATGRIVLGRAQVELGRAQAGLDAMAEGLRRMADNQSRSWMTLYLTWLAEARWLAGDVDGALAAVDEALSANPQEVFVRPQALTLRGDLRALRLGDPRADYLEASALAATIGSPPQQRAAARALRGLRVEKGLMA